MRSLVLTALVVLFFCSCRKHKLNRQTTTSEQFTTSLVVVSEIVQTFKHALINFDSSGQAIQPYIPLSNCGIPSDFKLDSTGNHYSFEVSYNDVDCLDLPSRIKSGTIRYQSLFDLENSLSPSNQITVFFSDFSIDENQIKGGLTINISSSSTQTIELENLEVYLNNYNQVAAILNGSLSFNTISGTETSYSHQASDSLCYQNITCISDNQIRISGSVNGINTEGRLYDVNLSSGLILAYCEFNPQLSDGNCILQPEDLRERQINFSPQSCDQIAEVTIGEKEHKIDLF